MTAEEAMKILRDEEEKNISILLGMPPKSQAREIDIKRLLEATKLAIMALGAIDQVMWERDIAESQLKEIGVGLGEKTDRVKVALELYTKLNDEMTKRNLTAEHIIEYMKFEDECIEKGFTFKSLIEAREKEEPYKPTTEKLLVGVGRCKCGVEFLDKETKYCGNCGQKLNWKDRSEEE